MGWAAGEGRPCWGSRNPSVGFRLAAWVCCPAWGLGAGRGFARASEPGPRNDPGPPRGVSSGGNR